MINKAIAKITDEAMKIDSELGFYIEETITNKCTAEDIAEKILKENKTLTNCIEEITEVARGKQKNGVAYIPPADIQTMALEYFEITEEETQEPIKEKPVDVMDFLI